MAKVEQCPGFETFGADVKAARETLGMSRTMFREILQHADESYWREHPVIRFDALYGRGEYEVMAAFCDRAYYSDEDCFKFCQFIKASDKADFDRAIENYKEKSLYDSGIRRSAHHPCHLRLPHRKRTVCHGGAVLLCKKGLL